MQTKLPMPKNMRISLPESFFNFSNIPCSKKNPIEANNMRYHTKVMEEMEISLPKMAVNPHKKTDKCICANECAGMSLRIKTA